jgi:hypothetical protein
LNARAVISQVIERGISLSLNGGNLTVKAATKPPDDLLARIKAHKNNIVAILEEDAANRRTAIPTCTQSCNGCRRIPVPRPASLEA